MSRLKILLLNPPGKRIYVRDYYCSKVSKAQYLYHPLDLLMLSGTLHTRHDIRVIDAMTQGWTPQTAQKAIRAFHPDVILFLTGVVSFPEDFLFVSNLQSELNCVCIASGELFLESPEKQLADIPFLNGAVLDFTSASILELLERIEPGHGFHQGKPIRDIVYRSIDGRIVDGSAPREVGGEYEIAIPRHELFPNQNYRYPFVRRFPFATILTDFGCAYHCRFCAIGQLGFKLRTIPNVIEELDRIRHLGFRDLYIDDQTFGADRERTEVLLETMIRREYPMGFICFSRADVIDPPLLKLMKRAHCHTIAIGVESSNDANLDAAHKGVSAARIRDAVSWCRAAGIRTVGTFVVGLPGMTVSEAETIGQYAVRIGLDFASFNVPVPRPGTGLRAEAIRNGWIRDILEPMDQSGSYAVMGNDHMSAEEVMFYRNQASRHFYLRPGYLLHRVLQIRTVYELKSHLREMLFLAFPKHFEKRH